MNDWWTILLLALAAYVLLYVLLYFVQDYFLFHPEKLRQDFVFSYDFDYEFEEIWLDMEDGSRINALRFFAPDSRGVVFYFKGNTRSVKGWGKFSEDFLPKGYDFFMIDYPGFGKSTGPRTEQTIYADAQAAYRWLTERYAEEQIVIYGRSLGAGFASRIAAMNRPRMLVLDSPYVTFARLAQRYAWMFPLKWILKYEIRLVDDIAQLSCPVRILHGDRDRLIPYAYSVELQRRFPEKVVLYTIPGAHHNNLPAKADYHASLQQVLDEASAPEKPSS